MSDPNSTYYRCIDCEYASKPDKPFNLVVGCDARKTNVHLNQRACTSFVVSIRRSNQWVESILKAVAMRIERKNNV